MAELVVLTILDHQVQYTLKQYHSHSFNSQHFSYGPNFLAPSGWLKSTLTEALEKAVDPGTAI